MRIVLDTNILVRAANGLPGLARELFERCTAKPYTIVISEFLLAEVDRAMRYPRVQSLFRCQSQAIPTTMPSLHWQWRVQHRFCAHEIAT